MPGLETRLSRTISRGIFVAVIKSCCIIINEMIVGRNINSKRRCMGCKCVSILLLPLIVDFFPPILSFIRDMLSGIHFKTNQNFPKKSTNISIKYSIPRQRTFLSIHVTAQWFFSIRNDRKSKQPSYFRQEVICTNRKHSKTPIWVNSDARNGRRFNYTYYIHGNTSTAHNRRSKRMEQNHPKPMRYTVKSSTGWETCKIYTRIGYAANNVYELFVYRPETANSASMVLQLNQ